MLDTDTLIKGYSFEKFTEKIRNLTNSEVGNYKNKQVFITERVDDFNPEVLLTRAILLDKTEKGKEYDASITVRRNSKNFCPKMDTITAFRVLYETDWADNGRFNVIDCKFSVALSYDADNKSLTYTHLYSKYRKNRLIHTVCYSVTERLDEAANLYISSIFNSAKKYDGIHNTAYKVLYTDLDTIHILPPAPIFNYDISEALEFLCDTIVLNN